MRIAIGRCVGALAGVALGLAVGAGSVLAAGGYALFGDATLVHPGNNSPTGVQLRSSSSVSPGYGGIDFNIPAGTTFFDIQNLATDYNFTAGSCAGGAPRFQINVDGVNAFVYIGPPPNYTNCPPNVWANTGNLAAPGGFVDTSQLPGGAFYDTFAAADVKYGSHSVTGVQLVTDGSWAFIGGTQTVLVDNVMINGTTYTFESAQSCKDGGWQQFTSSPGPFKNQGDCVSYFASGGKNAAG
jgi:hypothetical protein